MPPEPTAFNQAVLAHWLKETKVYILTFSTGEKKKKNLTPYCFHSVPRAAEAAGCWDTQGAGALAASHGENQRQGVPGSVPCLMGHILPPAAGGDKPHQRPASASPVLRCSRTAPDGALIWSQLPQQLWDTTHLVPQHRCHCRKL